jgi:hypothetical protein
MSTFLNKIVRFDNLNIIGILRNGEEDTYYVLRAKKTNTKLTVNTANAFPDLESLKKEIDNRIPLILVIDGKGILNKKIDVKNETDMSWTRNLDYSTIYHTTYSDNGLQFISFCRKNLIDETIKLFKAEGFQVIDFYIGAVTGVLLNESLKQGLLFSNECKLEFESDQLVSITTLKEPVAKNYEIGGMSVSNYHLPLYGAGIHFYLRQKSIAKNTGNEIDLQEMVYKKAFNRLGAIMLVFFFLALFSSYALIQYFNAQNAKLNLENMYSNRSYEMIQKLEKQKQNKIDILSETGFSSSRFISYYAYELVETIPAGMNLSELDVFPVKKEIKGNEKVAFTSRMIVIKGAVANESEFNNWLDTLRKMKWMKNFEIISFKKDRKDISQFEINIELKDV